MALWSTYNDVWDEPKTDIVLAICRIGTVAQARARDMWNVAITTAAKTALFAVTFQPVAAVAGASV